MYNLRQLRALDLSLNALSGVVSPLIGQLTRLTNLNLLVTPLASSQLTGTIPSVLWKMQLHILQLAGHDFTGTVEAVAPTLEVLNLANNRFYGTLPSFSTASNMNSL